MKIYTKSGDQGTTALYGGKRVNKYNARIQAYGTCDELNAHIGLARDWIEGEGHRALLLRIQHEIFELGSLLAADPDRPNLKLPEFKAESITTLEKAMDDMNEELPPMRFFILPGGAPVVSQLHIARCVCRRAERLVVELNEETTINPLILQYLNRLSDYLFVLARKIGQEINVEEIPWKPELKD